MKEKRVKILLSTYNGEKYIEEQLDSLLNQHYRNFTILIRDDGSKDNTVKVIKEYIQKYSGLIELIEGHNLGVIGSFMELVKCYDAKDDYIAFCDQDDFWEPDKIANAINVLEKEEEEIKGYCSNLNLVDENLVFIKQKYSKELIPNFNNAIYENIITGCTFVCSNNLLQIIKEKLNCVNLNNVLMHDWWFYLVGTAYGKICYDSNSSIAYRQHSSNVVGMETTLINQIKKRIKNIFKYRNKRVNQIKEFYNCYKDTLSNEKKVYLSKLVNSTSFVLRFNFIITEKIIRQNSMDEIATKLMFLFKIY